VEVNPQTTLSKPILDEQELKEQHMTFAENQRGVSYDSLFGPYLKGAKHITITDPYVRLFYQAKNLMELLETIIKQKAEEDEVVVSLITVEDEFKGDIQRDYFEKIQSSMFAVGIKFAYSFDTSGRQHARHIVTDTGWKVSLDRGLDIFQQYDVNDAFSLSTRLQKHRPCKAFEVTFIKVEE
ncbi:MAG: MIT C-terminal domain-containing protein, partial [Colwellia sp.]